MCPFRIGFGYDLHRLVQGRDLILGGLKIDHTHGLLGHSDADVLSHAIADAMLGAAGLRDIGFYFPDTDLQYKGIDSQFLLKECVTRIKQLGWNVVNIDSTIIAEAPKMNPHFNSMKVVLAKTLSIKPEVIGIKATTNEKTGAIGAHEAIAAYAVCLLLKDA